MPGRNIPSTVATLHANFTPAFYRRRAKLMGSRFRRPHADGKLISLTRLAPGLAVVGEEAAHADPTVLDSLSGACWIIDPIDGTSNFASGSGHFATMVALADAGETIAGWIYDPQRDRMCRARRGEGAFIDGERLSARPSGRDPQRLAAMMRYMAPGQRERFETGVAHQLRGLVESHGLRIQETAAESIGMIMLEP